MILSLYRASEYSARSGDDLPWPVVSETAVAAASVRRRPFGSALQGRVCRMWRPGRLHSASVQPPRNSVSTYCVSDTLTLFIAMFMATFKHNWSRWLYSLWKNFLHRLLRHVLCRQHAHGLVTRVSQQPDHVSGTPFQQRCRSDSISLALFKRHLKTLLFEYRTAAHCDCCFCVPCINTLIYLLINSKVHWVGLLWGCEVKPSEAYVWNDMTNIGRVQQFTRLLIKRITELCDVIHCWDTYIVYYVDVTSAVCVWVACWCLDCDRALRTSSSSTLRMASLWWVERSAPTTLTSSLTSLVRLF